jgi:hypothetical protein
MPFIEEEGPEVLKRVLRKAPWVGTVRTACRNANFWSW